MFLNRFFVMFYFIPEGLTYTHLCQYWVCFLFPCSLGVCLLLCVKQPGTREVFFYGNNAAHLFTSRKGCCVFVDGGFGVRAE